MKLEVGIDFIFKLLCELDILIENLCLGVVKWLGLGYDVVKVVKFDIVYIFMGMYGNEGLFSYQIGYVFCFVVLSGFSFLVGYEGQLLAGMNV